MNAMLLIGPLVVIAGLGVLGYWWRHHALRFPDQDWYEAPGRLFSSDRQARVTRYALARQSQQTLVSITNEAKADLAGEWSETAAALANELLTEIEQAQTQLAQILDARDRGVDLLSIVLFGRTKAGKSSLFAALSNTGFEGIGKGGQNFTREVHFVDLGGVRLIDTPGVDGVGSAPLESMTVSALHEADILVVEVTDDAVFAEDFKRLGALALSTRPYVVALNVGKGDTTLVVNSPERVFRDERLNQHKQRLRKALPDRTSDDRPIVPYHALSAAQARQHPHGKASQALWEASRVRQLIAEIVGAASAATEFARNSADEAVEMACKQLTAGQAVTDAKITARSHALARTITELEGILSEVAMAAGSNGVEAVDAHFADAEESLLDALEVSDADTFRAVVTRTLDPGRLNDVLTAVLQEGAASLGEKFEEFQADVKIAIEMAGGEDAYAGIHSNYQREQFERDLARGKATRRRLVRVGAFAAVALAAVAVAETGPEASALVAVAGTRVVKRLLPPIEVPKDNPARRRAALQELITDQNEAAKRDFQVSLRTQVLDPARTQLIAPLMSESQDLTRLQAVIATTSEGVDGVRSRVVARQQLQSKAPTESDAA